MSTRRKWLEIIEYISIFSSVLVILTIALTEQKLYVFLPLIIALLCNLLNRQLLKEQIRNYPKKLKQLQNAFNDRAELKEIEAIKIKLNEVVTTETLEQYQDQLIRHAIWEAIIGIDSQIKFLIDESDKRSDLSKIESLYERLKSLPTRSELNRIIEALEEVQQEKRHLNINIEQIHNAFRYRPELSEIEEIKEQLTRLATVEALEKLQVQLNNLSQNCNKLIGE